MIGKDGVHRDGFCRGCPVNVHRRDGDDVGSRGQGHVVDGKLIAGQRGGNGVDRYSRIRAGGIGDNAGDDNAAGRDVAQSAGAVIERSIGRGIEGLSPTRRLSRWGTLPQRGNDKR